MLLILNTFNKFGFLRFSSLIIVIGVLYLKEFNSLTLECDFQILSNHLGSHYACVAKNFKVDFSERFITEVEGNHTDGNSNDDVKEVFMLKQFCPYLPLNLGAHFKNLKILFIKNSKLHFVLDGDLKGLQLEKFDVSHNPIEKLGANFFEGQASIDRISFYNCYLKVIHPEVLDPLRKLEIAVFDFNRCIDKRTNQYSYSLSMLKSYIRNYCQETNDDENNFFKRFNDSFTCPETLIISPKSMPKSFVIKNIYFVIIIMTVLSAVLLALTFFNTRKI